MKTDTKAYMLYDSTYMGFLRKAKLDRQNPIYVFPGLGVGVEFIAKSTEGFGGYDNVLRLHCSDGCT